MMTATESSAQQAFLDNRDSFVQGMQALLSRYATSVPEISLRLARTGLAQDAMTDDLSLSCIPLLRKTALRAMQVSTPPWGGMLEEGFKPDVCLMSPGGVVEPLVARMTERLSEMLAGAGFNSTHTVLNGFNYHFTPAGLLFHTALVRLGCSVLPVGPQHTGMQVEFAGLMGANAFVGIASHLKILFDQQPALSISLAMAGAEPHGQAIRAHLLSQHGVRCFDMYGIAEAGILAASCAQAGALHFHPDVLTEVIDLVNATTLTCAEPGELVVSVDNPGFPLLRFATGDLVTFEPRVCACNKFGILNVLGRTDQSARVKGMLLHQSQVRQFMHAVNANACQINVTRVDGRDCIALKIRLNHGDADLQILQARFSETCRVRADQTESDDALIADSCTIADLRVR